MLHELVDQGNTVVVIEHNLEVIKTADWIVDLGPEGGDAGGHVVAVGTPEEIAANPASYTGHYLKQVFERRRQAEARRADRGGGVATSLRPKQRSDLAFVERHLVIRARARADHIIQFSSDYSLNPRVCNNVKVGWLATNFARSSSTLFN